MKDIREYIPQVSPLDFADKISLLYVGDEQYIAITLGRGDIAVDYEDNSINKETYTISSDFVPASAITVDKVGDNGKTSDYLIGWFNLSDFSDFSVANIGVALNGLDNEDIEYLEKYIDVDAYSYLKSIQPIPTAKLQEIIKDKVTLIKSVPLEKLADLDSLYYRRKYKDNVLNTEHEKANQHKIAIPHKIQPIKENDWSNIRIAKIDMQVFGGNSVIPFVWLQRTKLVRAARAF